MSELKEVMNVTQVSGERIPSGYYKKCEVDTVIAKLKEENLNLKAKNIELQSFYDLHGNVDNYIDNLNAENAELKAKLENVNELIKTARQMIEDAEIARLKDRRLDVKDAAHVLKAFKFYLCQLTHCAYDEHTAQWIVDNWEQDYKRVEEYK